jgi:methyl coenzyme M reductase beta subunit
MINKEEIKDKLEKILKVYEDDDARFGGYTATKRLHISAPEDYVESRTDWLSLQNHADDMYYMLSDIKNLLEECKNLL